MNDFFKKLNVLIKAGINERISGDEPHPRMSKTVEGDLASLRERVNDAVAYEDQIKARIRQFEDEAAGWDRRADEAVARGDDDNARYAIEQMRRAEQRAAVAQSDLREHQRVTQDLIQRVNTLDSAAAETRRSETGDAAPDDGLLNNVLRETREKIASLADLAAAQQNLQTPEAPAHEDEAAVDDDLERRRQRLSKR